MTYQVYPSIVSTGSPHTFRVERTVDARRIDPGRAGVVEILHRKDYRRSEVRPASIRADKGGLLSMEFSFRPERDGEYLIHFNPVEKRWPAPSLLDVSFFSVPPDLAARRPYKGDMHMHSYYSDGVQSPLHMAARCRQAGLDFAALTDHRCYESSLEAIRRARELDFRILMIPGEECNYCIGLGHVLSYGARAGVSERLLAESPFGSWESVDDAPFLESLVDHAQRKAGDEVAGTPLPPDVDRRIYAFYHWVVREVHRAGGRAVAAHPYWVSQRVVDLFSPVYEQVLKNGLVDGMELFGDVEFEDNMLSLARYAEEARQGRNLPIWASSDSHDMRSPLLGRIFTVAFAPRLQTMDVLDAILSRHATACYVLDDARTIVAGPPLLVEYTYFLLRGYFLEHDRLCRISGGLYEQEAQGRSVEPELKRSLHQALAQGEERHFDLSGAGGSGK